MDNDELELDINEVEAVSLDEYFKPAGVEYEFNGIDNFDSELYERGYQDGTAGLNLSGRKRWQYSYAVGWYEGYRDWLAEQRLSLEQAELEHQQAVLGVANLELIHSKLGFNMQWSKDFLKRQMATARTIQQDRMRARSRVRRAREKIAKLVESMRNGGQIS